MRRCLIGDGTSCLCQAPTLPSVEGYEDGPGMVSCLSLFPLLSSIGLSRSRSVGRTVWRMRTANVLSVTNRELPTDNQVDAVENVHVTCIPQPMTGPIYLPPPPPKSARRLMAHLPRPLVQLTVRLPLVPPIIRGLIEDRQPRRPRDAAPSA